MQDAAIVASEGRQFAVLIGGCGERGKRRGDRTAHHTGHMFPEMREALHARDRAEGGISGKYFVSAQAGQGDLHAGPARFPRNEVGIDSVHGGQVHRAQRVRNRGQNIGLRNTRRGLGGWPGGVYRLAGQFDCGNELVKVPGAFELPDKADRLLVGPGSPAGTSSASPSTA